MLHQRNHILLLERYEHRQTKPTQKHKKLKNGSVPTRQYVATNIHETIFSPIILKIWASTNQNYSENLQESKWLGLKSTIETLGEPTNQKYSRKKVGVESTNT